MFEPTSQTEQIEPGAGAPEAAQTAEAATPAAPAEAAPPQAVTEEPTYTVKYNGEQREVPLSELLVNAQKGMNYDRVVAQRDALRALQSEAAGAKGAGPAGAQEGVRHEDFCHLAQVYPEVRSLPGAVLEAISAGEKPLEAYRAYENNILRQRVAAMEQNQRAREKAIGSLEGEGPGQGPDAFLTGFESAFH